MRPPFQTLKLDDPQPAVLIGRVCQALSLLTLVGGVMVLGGWAFEIDRLKTFLPGLAPMKANTALGFVLCGFALFMLRDGGRPLADPTRTLVGRAAASFAGLIGLLTLAQYASSADFGIDEWLFAAGAEEGAPGRMSAFTAMNFVLAAAALLLLGVTLRSGRRPSHWLALAIVANSFLSSLGYLYGAESLYRSQLFATVAVHTALLFLALSGGIATARPVSQFIEQITGAHNAGVINRRLLPAALIVPPFLGWLRWQGELAGYYSTPFGLALFASSNVAVFASLAWWSARSIHRLSQQREEVSMISAWQRSILDGADFTVISTDRSGIIRTMNAVAERKLGYAAAELVGRSKPDIIHDPAEVVERATALSRELERTVEPGFETFVARSREGGADEHVWTYIRKDGSRFPVQLSVTPLRDASDRLTGFVGIGKDLTAQREAEAALLASENRVRVIADNIPALVAYVDLEERFRFVNARLARALDMNPESILGRTIREVGSEAIYAFMGDSIARPLSGESIVFEGKGPGGEKEHDYRFAHVPDRDEAGVVRGFYALAFDISDLKRAQAQLIQLAQFDSLTGLPNRNRLNDRLKDAIARSERSGQTMALMFLDLDGFKEINDRHGHRGGDEALQEFSRRLERSVRGTDTVARFAGDEFVVILESISHDKEAELVAGKILEALRAAFAVGGRPTPLSTSIGIAIRRPGETDGDALLRRADLAVYQMKREGRGGYRMAL